MLICAGPGASRHIKNCNVTEILLKVLLAYLLGSVLGALWVGRFLGHVDIRKMGSGNAGGTNALRTQGWLFAALVVVIDVGKGALAAAWLPLVDIPGIPAATGIEAGWLQVACGAAAVVGHVFPLYHGFRGGKGAATLAGALAFINWQALLVILVTWLLIVSLSGYVSLATTVSIAAAAVYCGVTSGISSPAFVFLLIMTLFIVFTHRSNIARLRAGTENRMAMLMLFKKKP